ncbi:MAG: arabinose operon transcriptional regulator AraC [Planctomycetota bacterium]|jgi:AraC family transcriptional regulator of arabinose operon|nr:arabinose operon transcriptional regulator AraC [Planctomycetota bacterium]
MARVSVDHFADRFGAGRTEMNDPQHAILRPHGMAGWILNATLMGRGSIGGGRERFRSRCGDLLLFAPTAIHDYHCESVHTQWVHYWAYFYPREHWQTWLRWDAVAPGILRVHITGEAWDEVLRNFELLVQEAHGGQPQHLDMAMCLLERILLLGRRHGGQAAERLDPRIAYAMEWMAARHQRDVSLDAVAAACDMSPSRLSHLFKDQVGVAPMRYLERLRIDRAREQLVMSTSGVGTIAMAVGFQDPEWFARVFKRHTGVSPRAFRQRTEA